MKKIFLGVVIFAIVSVLVTGVLIDIKKESLNTNDVFAGEKVDTLVSENEDISEKTIDLYGKYDENDLIVEKKTIKTPSGNFEIKIPQIKGLKNKTIENKVNKDIKDRISEIIGKFASNNEVKMLIRITK